MADLPNEVKDAVANSVPWLADRDWFFLYACVLGWVALVLLNYSVVLLIRYSICEGTEACLKNDLALRAVSRLAWEGSFICWGFVFALFSGWGTSVHMSLSRYLLAGLVGLIVAGGGGIAIAYQLGVRDDIDQAGFRLALFIVIGPLLFAITALTSNLVRANQVKRLKAGALLFIVLMLFIAGGLKLGVETHDALEKMLPTHPKP